MKTTKRTYRGISRTAAFFVAAAILLGAAATARAEHGVSALSPTDHQASKMVYFTIVKSDRPRTVTNFATTNVANVH